MLTTARYLVDTSVIVRLTNPTVVDALSAPITAGEVATCATVDLELFSLVREHVELAEVRALWTASFRWLPTDDTDLRRALEVQRLLADKGHHPVPWAALVVAAVAERHRVAVLHHNAIFDRIAEVTGQRVDWIVPQGAS